MCIPPASSFRGYPCEATCHVTAHARPASRMPLLAGCIFLIEKKSLAGIGL